MGTPCKTRKYRKSGKGDAWGRKGDGLFTISVNKRRKRAAKSLFFLQFSFRRNLGADNGGIGFAEGFLYSVRARAKRWVAILCWVIPERRKWKIWKTS